MGDELKVGPVGELTPGTIKGVGGYAVGNANGELFAVSRHCRHLRADLAGGSIDGEGRLVCPWHQSAYDVSSGRMVRGPQRGFEKVPGLGLLFKSLTRVLPLRTKQVVEHDGCYWLR